MAEARERAAPFQAPGDDFAAAVLSGLSRPHKSLPCRFLYDAVGSALFEEITGLPEYYPTRTEIGILEAHAPEMLQGVGYETVLVEFGSGSSVKTEILLGAVGGLGAYIPIDISQSALADAQARLRVRFPKLDVRLIAADFSAPIALPADVAQRRKLGFFPGSTIGNFPPMEATRLLAAMRETLSPDARLVIGVDLKKDPRRLVRAYDDAAGVTAAFNLNLLARINRELAGGFDLDAFRHAAIYNPLDGRVEMHLVSLRDQLVSVGKAQFRFRAGETIHTENAYKYSIPQFREMAQSAGWTSRRVWSDASGLFSVHELVAP
jgi:dimethylhistidine N-methyltransferase